MKHRLLPVILLSAALSLHACAANPGPPPVEEPGPSSTTSAAPVTPSPAPPSRAEAVINVGIDPLPAGFNPHLLSDDSHVTRSLAELLLPSTFRDGEMDLDLLVSAELVEPPAAPGRVVQTIRYVISPEAQWSDGTPITGADFRYLWRGMTSTPGVVAPAGYREITAVRTSGDGRTVDVDFRSLVADWRSLFDHLLPSHLLQVDATDFDVALDAGVPASGGRYMVSEVDRARGVVALNRNDRFWGTDPAQTDRVNFRVVRSVTQSADQLRSGQLNFLDTTPAETSVDAYRLVRDTQVRLVDLPRELVLTMSVTSPLLEDPAVRAELHSLLDVPLIARLAAGRSADLVVPPHAPGAEGTTPTLLPELTSGEHRPLVIGVDSADDTAVAAARTIVDMLSQVDVAAEVRTTDMAELTRTLLPTGKVDAVIAWQRTEVPAPETAGHWLCPVTPEAPRAGNLSGWCADETDEAARGLLSGEITPDVVAGVLAPVGEREHLHVPLLGERRVIVLGPGIVGPDPDLDTWTAGISTVASWRKL